MEKNLPSLLTQINSLSLPEKMQLRDALSREIDSDRKVALNQNFIFAVLPIDEFEECPNIK